MPIVFLTNLQFVSICLMNCMKSQWFSLHLDHFSSLDSQHVISCWAGNPGAHSRRAQSETGESRQADLIVLLPHRRFYGCIVVIHHDRPYCPCCWRFVIRNHPIDFEFNLKRHNVLQLKPVVRQACWWPCRGEGPLDWVIGQVRYTVTWHPAMSSTDASA